MSKKVNLQQLLGENLLAKQTGTPSPTGLSVLDGKYVGLYFSAHWCPPCRAFTPRLKKTYMVLTAMGKPFEIVFVSHDSNTQEFNEYYNEMPWAAVPFEQEAVRRALARQFGVSGIPALVIVAPDGTVVNGNARSAVIKDATGDRFPWEGEEEPSSSGPNMWMTLALMMLAWFAAQYLSSFWTSK